MSGRTLFDKIWDAHVVAREGEAAWLYVDQHVLNEVSSPSAFAQLAPANRRVRRPDLTLAVCDHVIPSENQALGLEGVADPEARALIDTLTRNAASHGIEFYPMGDVRNGIVHVVVAEQGRAQPGALLVCGDSYAPTAGAFGTLAFGVSASEVAHVLATQTLRMKKPRNMRVLLEGKPAPGVSAKDIALALVARLGISGATGHVVEFAGDALRALSMEERMTLCCMSVEAGAVSALIAPDEKTFLHLRGRPATPKGGGWQEALLTWRALASDPNAHWSTTVEIDCGTVAPMVSWGTNPEQAIAIDGAVPDREAIEDAAKREGARRALAYMGLEPGQKLEGLAVQRVFIGACANGRIEDLRAAAEIVRGKHVAPGVRALVVPASGLIAHQAEEEGFDIVFADAGLEWREPGCSMCIAMNGDSAAPGERVASTSGANFEGRQGRGVRTHVMSPAMAAAAAIAGAITDVRKRL